MTVSKQKKKKSKGSESRLNKQSRKSFSCANNNEVNRMVEEKSDKYESYKEEKKGKQNWLLVERKVKL